MTPARIGQAVFVVMAIAGLGYLGWAFLGWVGVAVAAVIVGVFGAALTSPRKDPRNG